MPPSPIITPQINQAAWLALMAELDFDADQVPKVKLKATTGGRYWGTARRGHPTEIVMYFGHDNWETTRLSLAMTECSRTLLHEVRHAWQYINKPPEWFDNECEYNLRPQEIDAEEFAHTNSHRYPTLVRLARKFPSSSFSRLSATERKVRG